MQRNFGGGDNDECRIGAGSMVTVTVFIISVGPGCARQSWEAGNTQRWTRYTQSLSCSLAEESNLKQTPEVPRVGDVTETFPRVAFKLRPRG